jgi:hypothetical protein
MFILPDFPATSSSWLAAEEQALAQLRMKEDVGGSNEEEMDDLKPEESGLNQALSDWKVWWLALASTSMKVMLSFSAFFPTLSATLGYSSTVSLLLCVPPWMVATCSAFLMSRSTIVRFYIYENLLTRYEIYERHSDKAGERFGHITVTLLVGITGYLMAMATMNTAVRYLSL